MSGAERCGELSNGELKLLARELASRFQWAPSPERDAVRQDIVLVRQEMLRRIGGDDDLPGVREPRRPRPSAGAASAARSEDGDAQ